MHVATPLEECERRDRKGLYAKARRGEIPEFTGISSPYEEPQDADVRVDTTGRTIDDALDDVLVALRGAGYLDLVDDAAPSAGRTEPVHGGRRGDPGSATGHRSLVAESPSDGNRAGSAARLSVLFVCTANICRSPYMELRARRSSSPAARSRSSSPVPAPTASAPAASTPTMADVLGARERQRRAVAAFRSRPLTRELVETADLVLTAESTHRAYVLEEAPSAFRKVFTLGQFADTVARRRRSGRRPGPGRLRRPPAGRRRTHHEISDPFSRGRAAANRAADQIDGLLRVVMPRLTGSGRITP